MDRITVIHRSLSAFVCGIFAFLPLIGLIPAVCALHHWRIVRANYADQWNPAARYLRIGVAFASFGLLSTILLGAVIALAIVNS